MTTRRIRTTATREEVKKLIRDLPGMLAGRKPSRFSLHKVYWGAIANSLFTSMYEAFLIKSKGGTDDLGIRWHDLEQHTKAYHRDVAQGGTKRSIIGRRRRVLKEGGMGLLTPQEYKLWSKLFGRVYHRYKHKLGDEAAMEKAGKYAWWALKEKGAPTMWEVLGNRELPILRNSDRLSESVAPGEFNLNSGYRKANRDQIFVLHRGSITMGTGVPHAVWVEKGKHPRIIWPKELKLWIDRANEAGRDAVFEKLQLILR